MIREKMGGLLLVPGIFFLYQFYFLNSWMWTENLGILEEDVDVTHFKKPLISAF